MSALLSSGKINSYFATDLKSSKLGYGLDSDELVVDILIEMDNLKKNYIALGDQNSLSEFYSLRDEFLLAIN